MSRVWAPAPLQTFAFDSLAYIYIYAYTDIDIDINTDIDIDIDYRFMRCIYAYIHIFVENGSLRGLLSVATTLASELMQMQC